MRKLLKWYNNLNGGDQFIIECYCLFFIAITVIAITMQLPKHSFR